MDGEVVGLDGRGEPSFGALGAGGRLVYAVFDLLWLDGASLLGRPLMERKQCLGDVLRDDPRVTFTDHVEGSGLAAYAAARERRLEGIVAKDRVSPYVPGLRSRAWRKVKIRPEQELVVGGWTQGTGPAAGLAALHVGVYEDGTLRTPARSARGSPGRAASSCWTRWSPCAPTRRRSRPLPRAAPSGVPRGCARSS